MAAACAMALAERLFFGGEAAELEQTGSTSPKVPGHLRTRRTHTTPHTDTTYTKGAGQWLQERKIG